MWNETARERYHFMDSEDFPSAQLPTDQATPPEAASNSRWRNPFWIGGLVGCILLVLLYLSGISAYGTELRV
jgi:hypothetical protein